MVRAERLAELVVGFHAARTHPSGRTRITINPLFYSPAKNENALTPCLLFAEVTHKQESLISS